MKCTNLSVPLDDGLELIPLRQQPVLALGVYRLDIIQLQLLDLVDAYLYKV